MLIDVITGTIQDFKDPVDYGFDPGDKKLRKEVLHSADQRQRAKVDLCSGAVEHQH